jgi:ABC-type sugar transport system ATPase subunit
VACADTIHQAYEKAYFADRIAAMGGCIVLNRPVDVACARAIAFQSKVLIMDEPTAALGVTEAGKLLSLIKNLKDIGLSILLITQRIPDILAIADRVFVLKGGQRQDVLEVSKVTLDDVVTMIVKGKGGNGVPAPEVGIQSFG